MDRLVLVTSTVDFRREEVRGPDGRRINLRPRAFSVLRCLADHAEQLVAKDDLLAECWPGTIVTEESLTQCISDIREALGDDARDVIRTIPRRGYMLMPPDQLVWGGQAIQPFAPDFVHLWPAIAVLPFDSFADGASFGVVLAEDVSTELARNRDLRVLARHTSFAAAAQGMTPSDITRIFQCRYVLGGSIRSEDTHVVVNVQLIDGRDSFQVWSERLAASAADLFTTQGGLAARIATRVFSEIREIESRAAMRANLDNLGPEELTRRGVAHLRAFNGTDTVKGRAALERAIALNPSFAPARVCLGHLNAVDAAFGLSGEIGPDTVPMAVEFVRCGIELAPMSAFGHQALGFAVGLTDRKDEALEAAQQSIELAPGDIRSLALLAYALIEVGDCEAGLSHLQRAGTLYPQSPVYNNLMAYALIGLGRHEECLAFAVEAARQSPSFTPAHINAAHALSALGRKQEGRARITELLDRNQSLTIKHPVTDVSYIRYPKIRSCYLEYLHDVGLPEGGPTPSSST